MLLTAAAAFADTQVTFQVDMTYAIQNSLFDPATQTVAARGTFDGWASPGFGLTNNTAAANPNLYSGTFDDTTDANGGVTAWQFVTVTAGNIAAYSSQHDGDNYCAALPTTSGASVVAPVVFFDDDGPSITADVTFRVDMAEQVNLGTFDTNASSTIEVHGVDGNWGSDLTLTNDPTIRTTNAVGIVTSNVYVGTMTITGPTNGAEEFKYVINSNNAGDAWEGPKTANADPDSGNRFFLITPQTLPIVGFSDQLLTVTVTNNVTFEIDMTTQIGVGNFPSGNTVEIHGDFVDANWDGPITMTNNTASATPNIYSTVIQYIGPAGAQRYFKYVIQPGSQWENISAANAINGNRWFDLPNTNGDFVVGPVYYSDQSPSTTNDFVLLPSTMVTFTVNMTNAVGNDTVVFDGSGLPVYINGLNNGVNNSFWTWGVLQPTTYQMTNIPGTDLYSITLPVNAGQQANLVYKYSINGVDDEAGFADNHQRWIRSMPNYTMPVDTFASQGSSAQSEISFGNLAVSKTSASQVQLSWLGRRGVELQTTTNLLSAGSVWTNQIQTDGANLIVAPGGMVSTNYTIGQGNLFYRLVGPQ